MNRTHKNSYIIAEMACSHDGERELAEQIIHGAGAAGADAIQFQIWLAEEVVSSRHKNLGLLQGIQLDRETWRGLSELVRSEYPQMDIIACIYERDSLDFCETMNVSAYKLHASDTANPSLIKAVAATGRRIDLSIGAATLGEIQQALEWITEAGGDDVWLMYGYQGFPTPTDGINLAFVEKLQTLFERRVGYQDHSDADEQSAYYLPAMALGMGVDILEKHITHDRSKKGIDHEAALNPEEFKHFVEMVRELERAKGIAVPRPFSEAEDKYRRYSRKSTLLAQARPAGHVLQENDFVYLRDEEMGLAPADSHSLIGRSLVRDLPAQHLIQPSDTQSA